MISIKREGKFIGNNLQQNAKGILLISASRAVKENMQAWMGQSGLLSLSYTYSRMKMAGQTKPKMRVFPGKAADQPLILTGKMLKGISYWPGSNFNTMIVGVLPSVGFDKNGDDYASPLIKRSHLMQKAVRLDGRYGAPKTSVAVHAAFIRASRGLKR